MTNALQSDLMLEDIVMNTLHGDNGPMTGHCFQQPGVEALKKAVADLKWCEDVCFRRNFKIVEIRRQRKEISPGDFILAFRWRYVVRAF